MVWVEYSCRLYRAGRWAFVYLRMQKESQEEDGGTRTRTRTTVKRGCSELGSRDVYPDVYSDMWMAWNESRHVLKPQMGT